MKQAPIDDRHDFASYYDQGLDPDRESLLLYQWHQRLWRRPIPGIGPFEIEIQRSGSYELSLRPITTAASFRLGSDAIVPTWSTDGWLWRFSPVLREEILKDENDFHRISSTIGAYIVFPRNTADQTGWTLNQARGVNAAIADRFDLTLECIRRHYQRPDAENPLADPLNRYADFFRLFGSFTGYVRFFLLDDLLTSDGAVISLMPGEQTVSLTRPALPASPEDYRDYRRRSIEFIRARGGRIAALGV